MKLILHIGTEKTGTTSLQNFISSIDSYNQKICVPRSFCLYENNMAGLVLAARPVTVFDDLNKFAKTKNSSDIMAYLDHATQNLEDELYKYSKIGCSSAVMSSEHLHSRLTKPEHIYTLKKFLAKFFDEISVFVYFRRQDKVIESFYTTSLLNGHIVDWENFSKKDFGYYLDYAAISDNWSSVFGFDQFFPFIYERAITENQGVVKHFAQQIKIDNDIDDVSVGIKLNSHISEKAQDCLLQFNILLRDAVKANKISELKADGMRNYFIENLRMLSIGKGRKLSADETLAILIKYTSINRRLAEKYFSRPEIYAWRAG